MFRFHCKSCGQWHEGMPTLAAEAPLFYYGVPEGEREARCQLGSDTCIVDGEHFFIRGCLEIPVHRETNPFIWGVWVSLSKVNFDRFVACFEGEKRSHIGPFFGWLSAGLLGYPDTENLKMRAHLRDGGIRPVIELEPTDHPLAVEQRDGITADRVAEIVAEHEQRGRHFASGTEEV